MTSLTPAQRASLTRALERRFGQGMMPYTFSIVTEGCSHPDAYSHRVTDPETGSWIVGAFMNGRLRVTACHDGAAPSSVVWTEPGRVRFAPMSRQSGGYDIVDRDTGSTDIGGASHWFGDLHFAEKACEALNAGKPCPSMSEMCEAPAAPIARHDRPMAAAGHTSYRHKGRFGWIMIGATDHADAMREARRSWSGAEEAGLQVWDGASYVDAFPVQFVEARTLRGDVVRRHGPFENNTAAMASVLDHEKLAADIHNRGRDPDDRERREVVCVSGSGPATSVPAIAPRPAPAIGRVWNPDATDVRHVPRMNGWVWGAWDRERNAYADDRWFNLGVEAQAHCDTLNAVAGSDRAA
ncbi:hypothetical protein PUR29_32990 [Methylobacterium ajmalii]|uniref:Uncharacterized protein n=1 Tax=Methylobacterium ajmalii TaxID=2738439 RepID=A0ABV0A466_9HYPH